MTPTFAVRDVSRWGRTGQRGGGGGMDSSLVWVDVPCPLCGARRDDPLLMVPTSHGMCRLARCAGCDMVYLNPRPGDGCLAQLYPDDYHAYQAPSRLPNGAWARLVCYLRRLAVSAYHR